jgi:hypothetical protein
MLSRYDGRYPEQVFTQPGPGPSIELHPSADKGAAGYSARFWPFWICLPEEPTQ